MKIFIETIHHKNQPYDTVGNWWFNVDGDLEIRVSDMGNPDYEFLVASHEMKEAKLCQKHGITEKQVSEFDEQFERERKQGLHSNEDEPGDDPYAPYKDFHFLATSMERIEAQALNVSWKEYEETILALEYE